LDNIFNNFFSQAALPVAEAMPVTDIYTDDDNKLVTEVHLPGFSKDDVDISINDSSLEIKGSKQDKEEKQDKKRTYMIRQSSSQFFRRIALPKEADANKVKADFKDGILRVEVPFKALPKAKKVAIGEAKT
jgi:HSP20 family protein